MTPTAILQASHADGVELILTPVGTIKATGDENAVRRWLPTIRARKADLLATLAQESPIRRWLNHIQEDDPAVIAEVLEKCRSDRAALVYFLNRAGELSPSKGIESRQTVSDRTSTNTRA